MRSPSTTRTYITTYQRSALSGCSRVRKVKRDSECRLEVLLSKLWSGTPSAQDPRLLTGLTFPAFFGVVAWFGLLCLILTNRNLFHSRVHDNGKVEVVMVTTAFNLESIAIETIQAANFILEF